MVVVCGCVWCVVVCGFGVCKGAACACGVSVFVFVCVHGVCLCCGDVQGVCVGKCECLSVSIRPSVGLCFCVVCGMGGVGGCVVCVLRR